MDISFRKSAKSASQFVYDGDMLIGAVRKNENWTVRGTRVDWTATHKGRIVGNADTRKAAAELLAKP